MKIYKYKNYKDYVAAQTEANKEKLHRTWVDKATVELVAKSVDYPVKRVLCHGTRNGTEQKLFKAAYPDAWVIGTEISETAGKFANTVQHDFHEPFEDFAGTFDILYSNSFDHAYDPAKALGTWRDQLAPGRRLFLEVALEGDINISNKWDCLQINDKEIRQLIADTGLLLVRTFRTNGGGKHRTVLYVVERPQ